MPPVSPSRTTKKSQSAKEAGKAPEIVEENWGSDPVGSEDDSLVDMVARLRDRIAALESEKTTQRIEPEGLDLSDDWVLLQYDPKAIPGAALTSSYFMVSLPEEITDESGNARVENNVTALLPGVQKVPAKFAEKVMAMPEGSTVHTMVERNVISLWAKTADLRKMPGNEVERTILATESQTLLNEWSKISIELPSRSQKTLKNQIEAMARPTESRTMFSSRASVRG